MATETETLVFEGWTVMLRRPPGPGPHPVFVLLHGWTGDENVMWVFADRLPKNSLLLTLRGLHPTPQGGFGWQPRLRRGWPTVEELLPASQAILDLLERLPALPALSGADFRQPGWVGFSQGAAVGFTLGLTQPQRVRMIIGLSGFVPDGAARLVPSQPLTGKPVFIAHGAQDEIVPVARARQAVELLSVAGAQVTYCEDDVGHKLSANCFRGMQEFTAALDL
jgi:phospholipase/carboxylesterase